jgi:hypothetical protein
MEASWIVFNPATIIGTTQSVDILPNISIKVMDDNMMARGRVLELEINCNFKRKNIHVFLS